MRAGKYAQPDTIDILLNGGPNDSLRCLVKSRVDNLHPSVAKRASDYLCPTIVTIKTRLGD
jgi:hypothetical protein